MHELFGVQIGHCFHNLPEDVGALLGRKGLTFFGLHEPEEIAVLGEL